jgi:hypothetical protein
LQKGVHIFLPEQKFCGQFLFTADYPPAAVILKNFRKTAELVECVSQSLRSVVNACSFLDLLRPFGVSFPHFFYDSLFDPLFAEAASDEYYPARSKNTYQLTESTQMILPEPHGTAAHDKIK